MSAFKTKDMVWAQSGNDYYHRPKSENLDNLPVGVYRLCVDEHGCLYLNKFKNSYELPEKIYNTDQDFIERVLKTFNTVKKNVGVLLTGVKGSGKTVTSKQICNQSGLPVIVVDQEFQGMPAFIGNIKQPLVIFVDEYEKVYEDESASLLPLMDGASSGVSSNDQRLFLLTANSTHINSNMLQRPGRVRYVKSYADLDQDTILELLDDRLKHAHHRRGTLAFISKLKIISIDIVMSVIEEVNLHDEDPEEFENVFNVKRLSNIFDLYEITDPNDPKLFRKGQTHESYSDEWIGTVFRGGGNKSLGEVQEVLDENTIVILSKSDDGTLKSKVYQMRPVVQYHSSFIDYF